MCDILKLADPCICHIINCLSFRTGIILLLQLEISVIFQIIHDASPFEVISECSFRKGTNRSNVPLIVS